jgi:DNA polymerase-4
LRLRDVPTVFWDKPCQYLYGIGKKKAEKLTRLGILTLGQLAIAADVLLSKHFGVMGAHLKRSANGIDPSVVNPEQEQSKSIGHTTTLPRDYTDRIEIHRVLLNLADQDSEKASQAGTHDFDNSDYDPRS